LGDLHFKQLSARLALEALLRAALAAEHGSSSHLHSKIVSPEKLTN
jgi:hypothetical protein